MGGRDALAAGQRQRILAATEQLVAERGCAGATIEQIAKRARVSSITFYDHFPGKEMAFLTAFDRAAMEARARLAEAAPADLPWPDQVREGLRALLREIAENPERARMCLVEAQKGGPSLRARYEAALDSAVPKLREGRFVGRPGAELPATLEETIAGGIAWLLRERLEAEGAEGVEEMLPELLDVAVRPYLGADEGPPLAIAREAD